MSCNNIEHFKEEIMIDVTNIFSERLKELRGKKTLQEVADSIGITRVAMGYYEKGERKPDIEILYKIADFYKVSADYLIGITDVKTPDIETKAIANSIGLSEDAISVLRTENTIGLKHVLECIDILIRDIHFRVEGKNYRPFMELFSNYIRFTGDKKKKYSLKRNGDISPAKPTAIEDGKAYYSTSNIYIDSKRLETMFLLEMEDTLKIIKEEYEKNPNFLD